MSDLPLLWWLMGKFSHHHIQNLVTQCQPSLSIVNYVQLLELQWTILNILAQVIIIFSSIKVIYVQLCSTMVNHCHILSAMFNYGQQWSTFGNHYEVLTSMMYCHHLWSTKVNHGHQRFVMVNYVHPWSTIVKVGYPYSTMVKQGQIGAMMVTHHVHHSLRLSTIDSLT